MLGTCESKNLLLIENNNLMNNFIKKNYIFAKNSLTGYYNMVSESIDAATLWQVSFPPCCQFTIFATWFYIFVFLLFQLSFRSLMNNMLKLFSTSQQQFVCCSTCCVNDKKFSPILQEIYSEVKAKYLKHIITDS